MYYISIIIFIYTTSMPVVVFVIVFITYDFIRFYACSVMMWLSDSVTSYRLHRPSSCRKKMVDLYFSGWRYVVSNPYDHNYSKVYSSYIFIMIQNITFL